jgi:hypothetical protein
MYRDTFGTRYYHDVGSQLVTFCDIFETVEKQFNRAVWDEPNKTADFGEFLRDYQWGTSKIRAV